LCGISIVEAEKDNQMYFDYMGKDYWKQLPSGHSQQQGGNSGVRQESPRQQQNLLSGIPLDAMRNNSNKLVNQDISIEPLEESNKNAENILRVVAGMPILIMTVIWGIDELCGWINGK